MNKQGTITVGGQAYDAVTGLPIAETAAVPQPEPSAAHTATSHAAKIHVTTQRSSTLNRKFVGQPKRLRTDITTAHRTTPVASQTVHKQTHPHVKRFAPHPTAVTRPTESHAPAVVHPHVAKAHALSAAKAEPRSAVHVPARDTGRDTIARAIENSHPQRGTHKSKFWQRQRVTSIVAATFALVLLGGYFTYLNMPSLSVRVAAAQAGIDAAYPDYHPDGYALNGPVTYTDGRVSMNFKANASEANFTVNQSESGWDSTAVLDNYVLPRAGSSYMPFTERGLTIYTFGNNAAWVNGGILYTIDGDAPLSNEQIRRIATSLL